MVLERRQVPALQHTHDSIRSLDLPYRLAGVLDAELLPAHDQDPAGQPGLRLLALERQRPRGLRPDPPS